MAGPGGRAAEPIHGQPGAGVRFDWGNAGAASLAKVCAALVVVDVLTFTTAVDVAVHRGIRVHPFPWGAQAAAYADRMGAALAVARTDVSPQRPYSLSPHALLSAPYVAELVLPSPNGAAICAAAGVSGIPVLAGCLRNGGAVARWLRRHGYGAPDRPVGVVAAGEKWPDGTLRPCVADLVGAGLVLDGLVEGPGGLSVEAAVTLATVDALPDLRAAVAGSVSGRELAAYGFGADVEAALAVDVSPVVPVLRDGAFGPALD
ncbi:2-phosphosulfolactate phosphatase [Pilimelia terevasa]|uniref:2-phosphosulfolactate phosphatase n=1 Tax=Pilimelia terevasa TaxID=53372 RepID=UPI001E40E8EA|nr:2-phosphosulfolactate phosphatase [Pilimelia terevasa]